MDLSTKVRFFAVADLETLSSVLADTQQLAIDRIDERRRVTRVPPLYRTDFSSYF